MRIGSRLVVALAFAMALGTARASRLLAQGFGTGEQELNVGAAEFVPADSNPSYEWEDVYGYLYSTGATARSGTPRSIFPTGP